MNRSTNKVTAWVSGNRSKTVIFIYQGRTLSAYPSMEITQGDNQIGAIGGRLEDSLGVKVTDGNGRPVLGVTVRFDDGTAITDSMFIPVSGTTVYRSSSSLETAITNNNFNTIPLVNNTDDTTTATLTKPSPGTTIFVQTDRSGIAQTHYQLSATAGNPRITASLVGSPATVSQVFRATGTADTRRASLVVVSGDNQRSNANTGVVTDPLVVRARSASGYRISNVIIKLKHSAGYLHLPLAQINQLIQV